MSESEPAAEQAAEQAAESPKAGVLQGDTGTETAMVIICALLVGLAAFFLFATTMAIPLNGRDIGLFAANDNLHRVVSAPAAFPEAPHAPLTLLGLALNWSIAAGAGMLHGGSILLHMLAAILAYLCARRLVPAGTPEPFAMVAGLFVAIGPVADGALDVASARAAMQATVFALLALHCFLIGGERAPFGLGTLICCIAAYAAAFGSHFAALALPLVFLGADFALGGSARVSRNGIAHAALLFFMLALGVARSSAGIGGADYAHGLGGVISGQAAFLLHALKDAVFLGGPDRLPAAAESAGTMGTLLLAVLAIAALGAVALRMRAGVGLWWMLMIAAAMPCLTPKGQLLAGGGGYLALTGLALALPALAMAMPVPALRTGMALAALAWAACGAFFNYRDAAAWTDPAAVWQAEAERTGDARAWQYLAEYQLTAPAAEGANPQQAALPALQAWHAKAPEDARAAAMLGGALLATGKADEALPVLQDALRLNPWNGAAAARIATAYEQRARTEGRDALLRARDYYARAQALGALSKQEMEPYALVLAGAGDIAGAAQVLKQAIGDTQDGPATAALKRFEAGAQQIRAREKASTEALAKASPTDSSGIVQRAEVEYLRGRYMQAFYLLDRVLRRDNANTAAWSMLGLVRARGGAEDAFLEEYGAAPAANSAAWDDLARRCATSNLWDAALTYLRRSPDGNAELRLATVAQELGQPQRMEQLLTQAAEAAPEDPLPWLRLGELAIQGKDLARATSALAEAQKRGASDEALKPLRDQLGTPATPGGTPMQKIVN